MSPVSIGEWVFTPPAPVLRCESPTVSTKQCKANTYRLVYGQPANLKQLVAKEGRPTERAIGYPGVVGNVSDALPTSARYAL